MAVRLGLFCRPHEVPGGSLRSCIDVARRADAAGWYSIHFGEHLVMGPDSGDYPYGPFPHDDQTPWPEPLTTLGAMAAVTDRLRLSTGVLLAPLRSAVLMAKSIATLDVLSEGRAELGVGTGWQRAEYEASGLPWGSRRQRLYDNVAACRQLWGRQPASFSSSTVTFSDVAAYPLPVQDRVPILFGVAIDHKSAAVIAELGDGWCPVGCDPEAIRRGVDLLREGFVTNDRDPAEMRIRARLPDAHWTGDGFDLKAALEPIPALRDAGVNIFALRLPPGLPSLDVVTEFLDVVPRAVRGTNGP